MNHFIENFKHLLGNRRHTTSFRRTRRCGVEPLERRDLMTVSPTSGPVEIPVADPSLDVDFSPPAVLHQEFDLQHLQPSDPDRAAASGLDRAAAPGSAMQIGMNVEGVFDWAAGWTFTDAFKHSRDWISHTYNRATEAFQWHGDRPVEVDRHGWPTRLARWTNDWAP